MLTVLGHSAVLFAASAAGLALGRRVICLNRPTDPSK
jgi:hypothetical protein